MDNAPQPLFLPRTSVRVVRSPFDGFAYRIFLALPEQAPPAAGYPAIFLLDANATFLTTVEAVRMRAARQDSTGVAPAIVIGIGYDTDNPYDQHRRVHDFTLPHTRDRPRGNAGPRPTGGAQTLARFIAEVVRPLVEREAPLDRARQALFGHSLGAYFVLSQLLLDPGAFESYVAISPSVWWDEPWLHANVPLLPARIGEEQAPRRALIAVGEYEQALAPWQQALPDTERIVALRQERAMVDRSRDLARLLAAHAPARLIMRFEELAGEDHSSSALTGISHGLRLALWDGAGTLHNV
ncbi:hypothetical protein FHS82_000207 [Pseudochelatococcus lubricantis]|uniref:Alpha/beta hydrolase n=1 Tax=Pseudochelatococcus lubricantis TaxID=1538102 RepID=A0ABX0UWZ0_9HYPH|nr:alpha/beta hydrolase-fold protein [Pseudochelatococcus lubricantis]NIJ56394.1 hypothetical protein [Pseudochelatococcus lubricantis]